MKESAQVIATLEKVLEMKFGSVSDDVKSIIRAEQDMTILRQWLTAAVQAETIEAFQRATRE